MWQTQPDNNLRFNVNNCHHVVIVYVLDGVDVSAVTGTFMRAIFEIAVVADVSHHAVAVGEVKFVTFFFVSFLFSRGI